MSRDGERVITAEVLLHDRKAAEKVARYLRDSGFQVSTVGAASVSIRSDVPTFEWVFQVRLSDAPVERARGEVHDYGPLGRAGFDAESTPVVPDDIAGDVEGVYVQQPPRLLR